MLCHYKLSSKNLAEYILNNNPVSTQNGNLYLLGVLRTGKKLNVLQQMVFMKYAICIALRKKLIHVHATTCCKYHFHNETGKIVERVIIKSPITDVLVLAVHYFPRIQNLKELWIEKGATTSVRNTHRFVPVHDICKIVPVTFSQILPAVHSLTGWESTSSFLGTGKKSVINAMKSKGFEYFRPPFATRIFCTTQKEKKTSHSNLNKL